MHLHRIGAMAHKAGCAGLVVAGLGLVSGAGPAVAQLPPTPPVAPATATDGAPSEALRRQALSPYRFILQNANAPVRAKPAAAVAVESKRPAAQSPATQAAAVPERAPAPAALASSASQPAPQPVSASPVAALTPVPVEAPAVAALRREIIPVKTDEPRLSGALMRERPSGVVKVAFEVRPDGSTGAIKVLASTNRALNRASIEAVAGWKFEPVDEVVPVETELAFTFD
jgi:TonB family protein